MHIEDFDKPTCRILREKLQSVLDEASASGDWGVKFKVGNMSFDDTSCTIQVKAETPEAEQVRDNWLDKFTQLDGIASKTADGYTLVEYHPKKRKYPYIMVGPQGGRYKISAEQARRRFGRVEAASALVNLKQTSAP